MIDCLEKTFYLTLIYLENGLSTSFQCLVRPLIRNQQASGSSPLGSSIDYRSDFKLSGFCLFGYY